MSEQENNTKKTTRRKGDGGVQEYAPGKFRAFLDIGYEDGKRKRKTFTGTSVLVQFQPGAPVKSTLPRFSRGRVFSLCDIRVTFVF